MRLGIFIGQQELDAFVTDVRGVADAGFGSVWAPQIFGLDALTALAVAAREVPDIAIGTAVVPTYPRHPTALASLALTAQAASGGRLTLGIGLSHQVVVENMWGLDFSRPARHMREYLSILMPLLTERSVAFEGETMKTMAQIQVGEVPPPSVLVAALGPRMLALAGATTDGTITWMTGPKTVASHIAPSITAAAKDAGRSDPRVVVALPVSVCDDPSEARERAGRIFAMYGGLPSYRAMLDREGAAEPADVVIAGDEASVRAQIENVFDGGATEFVAVPFHKPERTMDALAKLLG